MEVTTIAAISTPPGHGGVGIIKISGPDSINIALSIFCPKESLKHQNNITEKPFHSFSPESRYFYFGHIVDRSSGCIIDEVLLVVMRAPFSYTAEDVVEIQSHAGPVVMKSILRLLIEKGVLLAGPGEFTRRAFLNGRIDLTQAEAVADIINARSEKAIGMAMAQISGEFNLQIQSLRASLLDILSYVEAAIDFPDEIGDEIDVSILASRLEEELIVKIIKLIDCCDNQSFLREGLKIVIVGGPNVGKSSLMNKLIEKDRSIVTDIPGTTRDFIEDSFIANGVPIVLADTAGIHDTVDPVEQIGIEKAWKYISGADIILYTVDAGNTVSANDLCTLKKLGNKKIILVINKIDLPPDQIRFALPKDWRHIESVRISALYNQDIDKLKKFLVEKAFNSTCDVKDKIVPNLRHKICLETAMLSLTTAKDGFVKSQPYELVSIDLKLALTALLEITGENVKPDILDNIFNRFCIGK